jgi:hypothetical protein
MPQDRMHILKNVKQDRAFDQYLDTMINQKVRQEVSHRINGSEQMIISKYQKLIDINIKHKNHGIQ